MLLAEGLITLDDLDRARAIKAAKGGTLGQHLVLAGAIGSEELVRFLSRRFPIPRWPRQRLEVIPPSVTSTVSAAHARSLRVVPVAREGGVLTLATADPTAAHAINETARALGATPAVVLVSEEDLSFALERCYGPEAAGASRGDDVPLPLVRRAAERPASEGTGGVGGADEAIPLVRRIERPKEPPKLDFDTWSTGPAAAIAVEETPEAVVTSQPVDDVAGEGFDSSAPVRVRSEGEIIAAIGDAPDRDAVVSLALEYLRRCADRAGFFAVKRGEIRGVRIVDDRARNDAARTLFLPLSAPSTLRRVADERQVYLGPLDKTAADAVLSAALGGRPARVLVIPIVLRGKTAGLLTADGFASIVPPRPRLERLANAVADAFSKLIVRGKLP